MRKRMTKSLNWSERTQLLTAGLPAYDQSQMQWKAAVNLAIFLVDAFSKSLCLMSPVAPRVADAVRALLASLKCTVAGRQNILQYDRVTTAWT